MPKVKTRFAPSPTGYLHVGGLRTALYAYLFAHNQKGSFILRIEDTDQKREVKDATQHLQDMLKHFDLDYDELYIQSERTEIYKEHIDKLLESGNAYHCFCTSERLDKLREEQRMLKQATMYDRHCREITSEEVEQRIAANEKFVIRQKIPITETLKFKDIVRGNVRFDGRLIDDQVLIKSDGFPTYHLASVVDDHLMEITHVIRGEEWLPSTPKHIWLHRAFGWEEPEFAHMPLLLNKDRSKLSKRQGDVSVESYIDKGYQKESIMNFITFLGWHPGGDLNSEVMSLEELIESFSLEKVHKAGAIFDLEKLDWFDWQWRRRKYLKAIEEEAVKIDTNVEIITEKRGHKHFEFKKPEDRSAFLNKRAEKLLELCANKLDAKYQSDSDFLNKTVLSAEEKIIKDPKNVDEYIGFYYELPSYDKELLTHEKMKVDLEMAKQSISASKAALEQLEDFGDETAIKDCLVAVVEKLEVKNGQVFWPLRSAATGMQFSPGVFEVIFVLGKDETIKRLQIALEKLG